MAKLSKENTSGTLHPRENTTAAGSLSALNAEIVALSDGNAHVNIDVRGTFSATLSLIGSVDGTNYITLPVRPVNEFGSFAMGITAAGLYQATVAGFKIIKLVATSYVSGTANASFVATIAKVIEDTVADLFVSGTAAAAAGVTLTLPATPGLTHHITYLEIVRFASVAQGANAIPNLVTSTNLPGNPVWTLPREAAALGSTYEKVLNLTRPLRASAENVATTIITPAVSGIIWRVNVGYYLAP